MQKVALGISIVALALGIYAVVSSSSTPEQESMVGDTPITQTTNQSMASGDAGDQPRIAFIRTDSIYAKCQFIIDAEAQLERATVASENKFQRKAKAAEQEYQELVAYAQGPGVTEEELQIAQNRLMELEYELQQLQQSESQRVLRKEQELNSEVIERLTSFIARYAEENGIDLIINKGMSGEGVLYGSTPFDVTPEIVRGLNEEYALEQQVIEE